MRIPPMNAARVSKRRRSDRARYRAVALVLAGGGAAGMLAAAQVVPAQAASVALLARCTSAEHSLAFGFTSAGEPSMWAHGECLRKIPSDGDGANLSVKIKRNGTQVWSGGNGTGIVDATYICKGNARGDFTAEWSTGQTDGPESAPCG